MIRLLALSLFFASAARADDAALQVPSVPPAVSQPAAITAAPQAAMPQILVPLAVAPALSAAQRGAPAAAPEAKAAPGAIDELKQGAASSSKDASAAPARLQQRFDGSDGASKTVEQLIAETDVAHNAGPKTFSMTIGEHTAFLQYRLRENRLIILHTEVPHALEGRGVGGKIVKTALDYAREQGLKVNPLCPFADAYMRRHPEYQDLRAK